MNKDVWLRLEKLANSKQREEKSKQGRHANSCRKTLGRTRSIRVNSVKEKLRSQLMRSPDPDAIQEEMQRNKGYKGVKRKVHSFHVKKEKGFVEVLLFDEDMGSDALAKFSHPNSPPNSNDTDTGHWYKQYRRHHLEVFKCLLIIFDK